MLKKIITSLCTLYTFYNYSYVHALYDNNTCVNDINNINKIFVPERLYKCSSKLKSNTGTTDVIISWNVLENEIELSIKAETYGWLSLGFATSKDKMIGADSIIAWNDPNTMIPISKSYYLSSYSFDDIKNYEINFVDNIHLISFENMFELQFTLQYNEKYIDIIWAVNTDPPLNDEWFHDTWGSTTLDLLKCNFKNTISSNLFYIYIIIYLLLLISNPFLCFYLSKICCKSFKFNRKIHKPLKYSFFDFDFSWGELIVSNISIIITIGFILMIYYNWFFNYFLTLIQNTGYISTICLVILTIPVTKTNILTYTINLPFERAIKFHRILGYITFISILIHLIYVLNVYKKIDILFSTIPIGERKVVSIYGTIAFISCLLIMITSINIVRRKSFQLFIHTHKLFIIVYTAVILHCPIFYFLLIPILFYLFSVFKKIYAILFNKHELINIIAEQNIICLTFKNSLTNIKGGNYIFLCVPIISFIEWHPFSISEINDKNNTYSIHIKVNGDWTKKLYDYIIKNKDTKLKVYIEGLYGNLEINPIDYKTCIFLAGGIGITPMITSSIDIAKKCITSNDKNICKNIILVWTFKNYSDIENFSNQLIILNTLSNKTTQIQIHLYSSNLDNQLYNIDQNYTIINGRPNIEQIIKNNSTESTGIFACGPESFVKNAQEVAHKYKHDFHKEIFSF